MSLRPILLLRPARHARSNRAWAVCGLAAALGASSSVAAADAAPRTPPRVHLIAPGIARIASPRPYALASDRRLRMSVRLRAGARRLHVEMDGRDVTAHFRRGTRPRLRVASVRLHTGPNHIQVSAADGHGRRDADSVEVIGGRRRGGFLTVSGVHRREPARPLRVLVLAAVRPLRVVASLNGHRLRDILGRQPTTSGTVLLSASHGLRPGRNVLHVLAYRRNGTYDAERRAFVVARDRPLSGAGADVVTQQDKRLRLDGRASRPTHRGRRLAYRWDLIHRPPGSHARLRTRSSPRPLLTPDRPGRYEASLRVTERAQGRHPAFTAAASADTVTVTAQPAWGPIGGRLDTMGASGAITLAGNAVASSQPTSAVQVVVLHRGAPLPVASNVSYTGDAAGMAQMQSDMQELAGGATPEDSLVVIVGKPVGGGPPVQSAGLADFGKALQDVGAEVCGDSASTPCLSMSAVTSPTGSGFSVIGVPALNAGRAWQGSGDLGGYLQLDQSGLLYTFVAPDRAVVDTGGAGSQPASTASITVTDPTASGTVSPTPLATGILPSGATGGFLIAVADARTLALKAQDTIGTNYGNAAQDLQGQQGMDDMLAAYTSDPSSLIFVQSLGAPSPTTTTWGEIGTEIGQLGGTADTFDRIAGGPYALVGGAQLEGSGAETTAGQPAFPQGPGAPTKSPGTERVLLSRHADFRYQPASADPTDYTITGGSSTGPSQFGLAKIVALPPTAWPDDDQPHRAANAWITQQVGLCQSACGQADVRDYYVSDPDAFEGPADVYGAKIAALQCPSDESGFTQQDCEDLTTQLPIEIGIVESVREHVGDPKGQSDLQAPYGLSSSGISATLDSVTASVTSSLTFSNHDKALGTLAEISSAVLSIASSYVGLGGDDFAQDTALLDAASGGLDLADTVTDAAGGQPLIGGQIQTQAGELQTEAIQTYSDAVRQLSHVADLIVSDWGRLQAAKALSQEDPSWNLNSTDAFEAVQSQLQAASLQWFYGSLLPIGYKVLDLGSHGVGIECNINNSGRYQPYSGTPNSARYQFITGFTQGSPPQPVLDRWAMVLTTLAGNKGGSAMPTKFSDSLYTAFDPDFDFAGGGTRPPAGFTQRQLFTDSFVPPSAPCR